ncbi:MAG: beta-hydroxyacyl-ACP dehydratase [Oligoflexia bacterium]|nr:beta-hydroxyacyl-ACP dehydratase [Oligoflexia bacterium]
MTEIVNPATPEECAQVLELLPQKEPFRFIDKILELSETHIVTQRRFRPDEYYYRGHFPGEPITPGVILIETMAQAGLVALGIYIVLKIDPSLQRRALFTDCQIDFAQVVRPGELTTIRAERIYWRRNKLQSKVELTLSSGEIAAHGIVSGYAMELRR